MNGRLRALLVDDEPLALKRLARLLRATGRVDVVGTTIDPAAVPASLASDDVHVVFLDIQMPGVNGLELASRLPPQTHVVFTTAYDQYAVKAFETNAVDYLLKPVERERLERTLDRLERLRQQPPGVDLRAVLERLLRELPSRAAHTDRLTARVGERVQVIEVARVTHFFARDKGTYAVTPSGNHLVDYTIADLERKLDPAQFVRIHRATLVNLAYVQELHPMFAGGLVVRLNDDKRTELPVARDRVRALRERLGD